MINVIKCMRIKLLKFALFICNHGYIVTTKLVRFSTTDENIAKSAGTMHWRLAIHIPDDVSVLARAFFTAKDTIAVKAASADQRLTRLTNQPNRDSTVPMT